MIHEFSQAPLEYEVWIRNLQVFTIVDDVIAVGELIDGGVGNGAGPNVLQRVFRR